MTPKIDWPEGWDSEKGWPNAAKSQLTSERTWSAFDMALRTHHSTTLSAVMRGFSGSASHHPTLSLAELRGRCRDLGITTCTEYKKQYDLIPGAPSNPNLFYSDWVSWPDLFGQGVKSVISLDQLKKEVRSRGITSSTEYKKRYQEIPGAPSRPYKVYAEWVSFYDLFGRNQPHFTTFTQLKKAVKRLKITSIREYQSKYTEIPGAPSNPQVVYVDEWVNYHDFFGRASVKLSLNQLRKALRDRKVTSQKEYRKIYKQIPGAPSNPFVFYAKAGWVSFTHLFGRG